MTLQEATPESSPKAEIKAEEADSAAHREIASETGQTRFYTFGKKFFPCQVSFRVFFRFSRIFQ